MPTERYSYDPATGETYLVSGDARTLFTGDFTTLTNGAVDVRGYQLFNPATGRILSNASGPISITRMSNDNGKVVVDVGHEISGSALNVTGNRLASYTVSGEITVMDSVLGERSINVQASGVTGYGQRLLTYVDYAGVRQYEAVTMGDDNESEIRRIYSDSARWATPEEYSRAALMGYLRKQEGRSINSISGVDGVQDVLDNLDRAGYEYVLPLAQITGGSLSFTRSFRVNDAGQIGSLYGP